MMFDRNVSGNMIDIEIDMTVFSDRVINPSQVHTHENAKQNTSSSATPSSTPTAPPSGR
ncbi:hypothetical protein D3C83_183750 [compost metagenome]